MVKPKTRFLMVALALTFTLIAAHTALAYDASATGYYLPEGYKVTAEVSIPGAPFWPGELVGSVFGLSTDDYSVLVVASSVKGQVWEGFSTWDGCKVVWVQSGREEVKAKVSLTPGKHDVTIVYGWDGTVKISVDGEMLFSFVATAGKYSVVAQGAKVNAPEELPKTTATASTGGGYNPPTVKDIQLRYTLLGVGAGGVALASLLVIKRKR